MFSSISTCRLPVQAKLPSLQLKVNSNYFLPVKYTSNLVVIVDRFLGKACVCTDKISALSHIIECHGSKLKHYYKLPSLQHHLETVFLYIRTEQNRTEVIQDLSIHIAHRLNTIYTFIIYISPISETPHCKM